MTTVGALATQAPQSEFEIARWEEEHSHPTPMGWLRGQLLSPSIRQVDPEVRGFNAWEGGRDVVQQVGASFLAGYNSGLTAKSPLSAGSRLQTLPPSLRGFAMEGLGMAGGVRDALAPGRSHFARLLLRYGETHNYMLHVGLGWAMARLPRPAWPRPSQLNPLLAPLALDGFGFHQVFFCTERVLAERRVGFPTGAWPGSTHNTNQQLMQGVGRGLWFVCGGRPDLVNREINRFHAGFKGSLWAGVGLASSYAGGIDESGLIKLRDLAGDNRPQLRQGSAFAVEARFRSDTVVAHTLMASRVLLDRDPVETSAVVTRCRPSASRFDNGDWSSYEQWRVCLAEEL